MTNLNEQLFQAIDTIISKRLEEVVLDKTIQCTVVKQTSKELNEYEVTNNSIVYKAIAKTNEYYQTGDSVCVSVLADSNEKIILGKYTLNQEDGFAYEDPFDHFVIDQTLLLIHDNDKAEQPRLSLNNDNQAITQSIALTPANAIPISLSGYDFMGLEFGIEVKGLSNNYAGDWAIGVTLLDINGNTLHEMYDGEKGLKISPYLLASDEIIGNPYTLTANFKQHKLFYFPKSIQLSQINKVLLTLYSNSNFPMANTASELIVTNFQLAFGFDANKYLDAPIHLYTENHIGSDYKYNTVDLVDNEQKPVIRALIVDQEDKKIIKELPDGQHLRWYQYAEGEPGDAYGGGYWKLIKAGQELFISPQEYELDLSSPTSQVKAVLCHEAPALSVDMNKIHTIVFDDCRAIDIDLSQITDKEKDKIFIYNQQPSEKATKKTYAAQWNAEAQRWVSELWAWPKSEDWLSQNIKDPIIGKSMAAVMWLKNKNAILLNNTIKYYRYMGDYGWIEVDIEQLNQEVLAASAPFVFTNSNLITGEHDDVISIIASYDKKIWFSIKDNWLNYTNGRVINDYRKIYLKVVPTSATIRSSPNQEPTYNWDNIEHSSWPINRAKNVVLWQIIRGGLIQGICSDREDLEEIDLDTINTKILTFYNGANEVEIATDEIIVAILRSNFDSVQAANTCNQISCNVRGISTVEQFSFGESGSQGTGYSFKINIAPGSAPYLYTGPKTDRLGVQLKTILTNSEGVELPDDSVTWSIDRQSYREPAYADEEDGQLFECFDITEDGWLYWRDDASSSNYLNSDSIVTVRRGCIVKASCKVNALQYTNDGSVTRTISLNAKYPIPIVDGQFNTDEYVPNLQGVFDVQWNDEGVPLTRLDNAEPYQFFQDTAWRYASSSNTFTVNENNQLQYAISDIKGMTTDKVYVTATNNGVTVAISAILQTMNVYDVDVANKWAGSSVWINNEEATVMSTMVGAGTKNPNNVFSGILMGHIVKQDGAQLTGLYGYDRTGAMTFSIDSNTGEAYFKSGRIGNWSLKDGAMSLTYLIPDTNNRRYVFFQGFSDGPTDPSNRAMIGSYIVDESGGVAEQTFYVTQGGYLYAKNAYIEGYVNATTGIFSGDIYASNGDIGGWHISSDRIKKEFTSNGKPRTVFLRAGDVSDSSAAFGVYNYLGDTSGRQEMLFCVCYDGAMYATRGQIASWNIGARSLYNKYPLSYTSGGTTQQGYRYTFMQCLGDEGNAAFGVYLYNKDMNQILDQPFYVRNDGHLHATNADITGTIQATKGNFSNDITIGGTTITAGHIRQLYNGAVGGIIDAVQVKRIEADSGTVGGWNIGYSSLQATGQGATTTIDGYGLEATYKGDTIIAGWYDMIIGAMHGGPSDLRLKNTICNIDNKYEAFFNALRPTTFYYNDDANCCDSDKLHFGFVAQDVLDAQANCGLNDLSIVHNGAYYSLQRQEIIALNTWQIQKAKTRIAELEKRVQQLEEILMNKE